MRQNMSSILPANTYHGVLESRMLYRCEDGKSAFKVYFVSIIGREDRARTEWKESSLSQTDILASLNKIDGIEGIGFIVAFPHIAKVFRFGPESEAVANVLAFSPRDGKRIDLARCQHYVEFACYAEAAMASDEFDFWAQAESVEEYLKQWSNRADWPVKRHKKLLAYWKAH